MKITYSPPKNCAIVIFCDDEPWREIHSAIFGRKPALPKTVTSLSELSSQFQTLEYQAARRYVYKRLAAQNFHSEALKKALCQRYVTPDVAEQVVAECQSEGYVNDAAWVEGFVRTQLSRKCGPALILAKLRAKGIPKQFIEDVLEELDSPEQRAERIQRLISTRYRSRDLSNPEERRKVVNSLLMKGFSFEEIRSIVEDF